MSLQFRSSAGGVWRENEVELWKGGGKGRFSVSLRRALGQPVAPQPMTPVLPIVAKEYAKERMEETMRISLRGFAARPFAFARTADFAVCDGMPVVGDAFATHVSKMQTDGSFKLRLHSFN
ncbi:hypothetical protein V6C03_13415 [Methyloligella sp. 2.7D]|uniref:hypothetical protein n=1 Tax=unclassified Methyloligella TaxID=2625955 RepID=UPI00157C48C8|nr:hypothetical protein [Methyloligella sp. GL2]QKP77232.1 hypothetical protein HT051_07050 [Methyloligella sp. GL2]